MDISIVPSFNESHKQLAKSWLLNMLRHDQLSYGSLPNDLQHKYCLFIDQTPYVLVRGNWSLQMPYLYLGGGSAVFDLHTKLSLLVSFATLMHLNQDTEVLDLITTRLNRIILEGVGTVYHQLIQSIQPIAQIAVDPASSRVAAQINEKWLLPNGQEVEVQDTWIKMSV